MRELFAVTERLLVPKLADFILRKRYCQKHLKEFVKKHKVPITDRITVNQLLGICSVCGKGGIVYYLGGDLTPNPNTSSTKKK